MENFKKIYRIGMGKTYGGASYSIFVKAEYTDGRLSISGVEGPRSSGNCLGGSGQINMSLKAKDIKPVNGWTHDKIARLLEIWDRWHLNDMHAGCQHQRANWDFDEKLSLSEYGSTNKYYAISNKASSGELSIEDYKLLIDIASAVEPNRPKFETESIKNLLDEGWIELDRIHDESADRVFPHQHPQGLLTKPCEVCGYKYGTAWLKEEVPENVLQELKDFPDTDKKPAWI